MYNTLPPNEREIVKDVFLIELQLHLAAVTMLCWFNKSYLALFTMAEFVVPSNCDPWWSPWQCESHLHPNLWAQRTSWGNQWSLWQRGCGTKGQFNTYILWYLNEMMMLDVRFSLRLWCRVEVSGFNAETVCAGIQTSDLFLDSFVLYGQVSSLSTLLMKFHLHRASRLKFSQWMYFPTQVLQLDPKFNPVEDYRVPLGLQKYNYFIWIGVQLVPLSCV